MKKILLFTYILVLILIPINVRAAEITTTEISGTVEKTIGEELSLDFKINFSGIEKGNNKNLGIWLVSFELLFDEEVLIVSGVSSPDFDSYVYKEDGKYYVLSEVIENSTSNNICTNGVLYCGDYTVTVKFYLKNTELKNTTIKMGKSEVGLLDITDETKTYTLDDIITINNTKEQTHTLNIKTSTEEITDIPENIKDITTNNNPVNNIEKKTSKKQESENEKLSNAFIKELKIDNYKIDFDKNKTNYNITVKENINELDVKVTLENDRATYKVFGADDLKDNNNEIAIEVTAEDNTKLIYTVNVKYEEVSQEIIKEESKIEISLKELLTKKNLTYAAIALGIIIIIILIILLINKKENKKINKLLGEL